MKCWKLNPKERPSFKELHSDISSLLERVAGYLDMGACPTFDANMAASPASDEQGSQEEEKFEEDTDY